MVLDMYCEASTFARSPLATWAFCRMILRTQWREGSWRAPATPIISRKALWTTLLIGMLAAVIQSTTVLATARLLDAPTNVTMLAGFEVGRAAPLTMCLVT